MPSTETVHACRSAAAEPEARREFEPSAVQAALVYVLVTLALTWPQALRLDSVPDHVDAYFSLWRLGWIAHQLPVDPWRLFDANIFHPARHTLAYSDAVLLQGVLAAPFIWLGVPVVVIYNLLVLVSFPLCGVSVYLLVRRVVGRADVGVLGGLVFAFGAFRFDHYIHLELLWAQWMPLALLCVHRALESGRIRDGLLAGACVAALGLSCIYYVVFFATALVVVVPVMATGVPPAKRRAAASALLAGTLLVVLVLTPYAARYAAARAEVGERAAGTAVLYAAGPKHFLAATPGNLLYGRLTASLGSHEKFLFPGFAALLLLVAGVWPPINRTRLAYVVLLAVAIDIAFGHRGLAYGFLREHVAVYRGLRVPARAGHVALLAIAVLASYGAARIRVRCRRAGPRCPGAVVAALGAVTVCELAVAGPALTSVATEPGDVYRWLRTQPPGVVAELPLPSPEPGARSFDAEFAYLSTFHWRPLVNGYSGETPPGYTALLRAAADFPSPRSLEALRAADVVYLVLHERFCGADRYERWTSLLGASTDLEPYGPFIDQRGEVRAYRLLPRVR